MVPRVKVFDVYHAQLRYCPLRTLTIVRDTSGPSSRLRAEDQIIMCRSKHSEIFLRLLDSRGHDLADIPKDRKLNIRAARPGLQAKVALFY